MVWKLAGGDAARALGLGDEFLSWARVILEHMFEELKTEVDRIAARDLSVGAAGLGNEVCELFVLTRRVEAQYARYLAAFDNAGGWSDEQLTCAAWLRTQTTLSHGQAAAQAGVARLRPQLPQLFAVYDEGKCSFAHLSAVRANLRLLPVELWGDVDGPLAVVAPAMTSSELAEYLRKLAEALADDPKPKDETRHENRRLSVATGFDGMTTVAGRLAPEVGEKLRAALSAASRPDVEGEVRFKNQRTADALESVLDAVLDSAALPVEGGEKPHITLTVDLNRIDEASQRAEQGPNPYRHLAPHERVAAARAAAEATGGPRYAWAGPASVAAARQLTCDGIILPIFTRNGQPIDVGRRTRIINSALRALIVARDRHCRWPGCTMEARWSQIHHVAHWRDGGRTDRSNLILICAPHHKAAHSGRFVVVLEKPGVISVRPRTLPDDPLYEIRNPQPPDPPPGYASWTDKISAVASIYRSAA
jgi:Domain of unknown function (DUF222)/HNH endonuclease